MSAQTRAVRGAVSVEPGGDEPRRMVEATGRLVRQLAEANGFEPADLVSIQFTQTEDLAEMNAAAALRKACPEYARVPLFCAQEPRVTDSPRRMVRVLATWRGEGGEPVPIYLGRAAGLRPDLFPDA